MQTLKEWLESVRRALLEEGFKFTEFQHVKPGQYFGLVKDLKRGLQMHVRAFRDGKLEAEIEISRFYLEHPQWKRPAGEELSRILKRHRIPHLKETLILPPQPGRMPKTRTDWRRSLLHPLAYKILALYTLCLGVILLALFIRTEGWIRGPLFLGGGLLVTLGIGIWVVVRAIERALRSPS